MGLPPLPEEFALELGRPERGWSNRITQDEVRDVLVAEFE